MRRGSFFRAENRRDTKGGRCCGFESLESRRVMAGNVTAEVINGDLIITGDDAANGIFFYELGSGTIGIGSYGMPVGPMLPAFDHTEINGESSGATFSGVTGNVIVRLAGGDDVVLFNAGFSAPGDVLIDGGNGLDTIRLDDVQAYAVTSGTGSIVRASIAGQVQVYSGGDGANVSIAYYDIAGDISITLEPTAAASPNETNYININRVTSKALSVTGSTGQDSVSFSGSTSRGIRIATLGGNDKIYVHAESVVGDSLLDAGEGTDSLFVSGQFGAELVVEGGAGADSFHLGGQQLPYAFYAVGTDPHVLIYDQMQRGAGDTLAVRVNLWVNSGGGDFVNVQFTSTGWLRINSLNTNTPEYVRLRNVLCGAITIEASGGDDIVDLFNVRSTQSFSGDLGHGNNSFSASMVAFEGTTSYISTFDQTSLVPVSVFFGGDGTDRFAFEGVRHTGATRFDTGGGDDRVSFVASLLSDPNIDIKTGHGRDRVTFEYCLADTITLNTGSGDDVVATRVSAVNKVFYDLGEGSDSLEIFGSIFNQEGTVNGGPGGDVLTRRASRLKMFGVLGFEQTNDGGLVVEPAPRGIRPLAAR